MLALAPEAPPLVVVGVGVGVGEDDGVVIVAEPLDELLGICWTTG